jgi:hypothetical protein
MDLNLHKRVVHACRQFSRQHEAETCRALRVAVPQYLSCAEYLRVYEAK